MQFVELGAKALKANMALFVLIVLKRKKEFGRGKLMTDVCKLIITKGFQNRYGC